MASINEIASEKCWVALTHDNLDVKVVMNKVRDPQAGAIVVFAGSIIWC